MKAENVSSVTKVIFISGVLANNAKGMTVGEIQQVVRFMTKGQCQRVLDDLVSEGFAYHENKPHGRTGKRVYYMTEAYAMEISYIAGGYAKHYNGGF